jgi:hypothetical protein
VRFAGSRTHCRNKRGVSHLADPDPAIGNPVEHSQYRIFLGSVIDCLQEEEA